MQAYERARAKSGRSHRAKGGHPPRTAHPGPAAVLMRPNACVRPPPPPQVLARVLEVERQNKQPCGLHRLLLRAGAVAELAGNRAPPHVPGMLCGACVECIARERPRSSRVHARAACAAGRPAGLPAGVALKRRTLPPHTTACPPALLPLAHCVLPWLHAVCVRALPHQLALFRARCVGVRG